MWRCWGCCQAQPDRRRRMSSFDVASDLGILGLMRGPSYVQTSLVSARSRLFYIGRIGLAAFWRAGTSDNQGWHGDCRCFEWPVDLYLLDLYYCSFGFGGRSPKECRVRLLIAIPIFNERKFVNK